MKLMHSCREVAQLIIAREDRKLTMAERIAMRTHLLMCKACPQFERQVLVMRNAMKLWRDK